MITIYKYPLRLDVGNPVSIRMPFSAVVLDAQIQNDFITIWAKVNSMDEINNRSFMVYGTGDNIVMSNLAYISTVQTIAGYVWHIFEIITPNH